MTAAEKIAYARVWYAKGECPGCGASLRKTAGQGHRHYLPGMKVADPSAKDYRRVTELGEVAGRGLSVASVDQRLYEWTSDQLASLVLIGSGVVTSHD